MLHKFDEKAMKAALRRLKPASRLLCAVTVAERLFPLYVAFCEESGRGDQALMRSTLDQLWRLAIEPKTEVELPSADDLYDLIPGDVNDEHEWGHFDYYADDAGSAIFYACECAVGGKVQDAYWALNRAKSAVEMYSEGFQNLQSELGQQELQKIPNNEHYQREFASQQRDLAEIERFGDRTEGRAEFAKSLRERAAAEGLVFLEAVRALPDPPDDEPDIDGPWW